MCANAYIGKLEDGTVAVYQSLEWDNRAWLSANASNGSANKMGYVGFEICQDDYSDRAYFMDAVMDKSVLLTAHLCSLFGVKPFDVIKDFKQGKAYAVIDHAEIGRLNIGSDHSDISEWLKVYGYTMDDYRNAVQAAMDEGVEVEYIDCDAEADKMEVLYKVKVVCPGSYLNLRTGAGKVFDSISKVYRGTVVDVIDETNAEWVRVDYNGLRGYLMKREGTDIYLERIASTVEKTPESGTPDTNIWTEVKKKAEELSALIGKALKQ